MKENRKCTKEKDYEKKFERKCAEEDQNEKSKSFRIGK